MKKSKIIVPALGLLLLSTAASVSGTVAWFTANRTYDTKVSTFTAGAVDGSLAATVAAGIGTSVVENTTPANNTIQFKKAGAAGADILTDATYDHVNNLLYTDNSAASEAGSGSNTNSFHLVGTDGTPTEPNYKVSTTATNYYYYGVTWTISLTYTYGGDEHDVHLFLDPTNSSLIEGTIATDNTGSGHVTTAMRFAFINGTNKRVWAPMQEEANCRYATAANASTTYTDAVLVASDYATNNSTISSASAYAPAGDNIDKATASARGDYLGTIKFADATAGVATLNLTVVAWLDGMDPNCLSNNDFYNMSASMRFYARTSSETTNA